MPAASDPFAPKLWLLAYNLPMKTWDSCGYSPAMEAQYEREFYDLYRATAPDRDTAEALAQAQRRREASLTPRQRELLGGSGGRRPATTGCPGHRPVAPDHGDPAR